MSVNQEFSQALASGKFKAAPSRSTLPVKNKKAQSPGSPRKEESSSAMILILISWLKLIRCLRKNTFLRIVWLFSLKISSLQSHLAWICLPELLFVKKCACDLPLRALKLTGVRTIGGLDVLLHLIAISHFAFFSEPKKIEEGNYPAVLINHRKIKYRHKVFWVAHESWDCTHSTFSPAERRKRGNVTNCGNGSWKSLLSHGLTSCALNEKQK